MHQMLYTKSFHCMRCSLLGNTELRAGYGFMIARIRGEKIEGDEGFCKVEKLCLLKFCYAINPRVQGNFLFFALATRGSLEFFFKTLIPFLSIVKEQLLCCMFNLSVMHRVLHYIDELIQM